MQARIVTYDEHGTQTKISEMVSAHIAFAERPPIINIEIKLTPKKFLGVQIPVFELELEIKRLRAAGKI